MATSNIEARLIELGCIPWDKSEVIRYGYLDYFYGRDEIFRFLEREKGNLCSDLISLQQALMGGPLSTESATIYRFWIDDSWAEGDGRVFIKEGSLAKRQITDDPAKVLDRPTEELLKLDGGTSQWASAEYLRRWRLGTAEKIKNPPAKLQLTYDVVDNWLMCGMLGKPWSPRRDETILRQAIAVADILEMGETTWRSQDSEDCCLGIALGLSIEEAERLFHSAENHETNRFKEMPKVIADVEAGREIVSTDHRPIWAGVALQLIQGREIKVKYREAVGKSWPPSQFWKCVDFLQKIKPRVD